MSGASVSDVNDRLSALELRVQQQEDELTVMKAALADVLRRLAASEVSTTASTKKQAGGKGNVGDFLMAECSVVLLAVTRHTPARVNVLDRDLPIGTGATGAWVPRVPPMMNGLHSSITLDSPFAPAGGASIREAFSLSCIANGGTSGRKRESTSVTRRETVSSAAKRYAHASTHSLTHTRVGWLQL